MKVTVIATGKQKRGAYEELAETYLKRLKAYLPCRMVELPQVKSGHADTIKSKEAESQLAAIPPNSTVIILDEHGKGLTTRQFSTKLESYKMEGKDLCFIIGGAEGLADTIKQKATLTLKLSDFVLPHQLARVVLLEQLYRAVTILAGHPYHRD